MTDDVRIVNYGFDGVASEATLKDLVEAVKSLAIKSGSDPSTQVKKTIGIFNTALKNLKKSIDDNVDSFDKNTKEIEENTKTIQKNTEALNDMLSSTTDTKNGIKLTNDAFENFAIKTLESFGSTLNSVETSMGTLVGSIGNSVDKLNDFATKLTDTAAPNSTQTLENFLDSILDSSQQSNSRTTGGANSLSNILDSLSRRTGDLNGDFGNLGGGLDNLIEEVTQFRDALRNQRSTTKILLNGLSYIAGAAWTFGTALLTQSDKISEVVGAIPFVGGILKPLALIVEDLISTFRIMTNVGIDFGSSLFDLRRSAAESGLTLETFIDILRYNSENLALFGGSATAGATIFKNVSKIVQTEFGQTFSNLGLTMEETAKSTADFLELQRRLGNAQRYNDRELAIGTQNYIFMLDRLARLTGRQRDLISSDIERNMADAKFSAFLSTLGDSGQKSVLSFMQLTSTIGSEVEDGMKTLFRTGGIPIDESSKTLALTLEKLGVGMDELSIVRDQLQAGLISDTDAYERIFGQAADSAKNFSESQLKELQYLIGSQGLGASIAETIFKLRQTSSSFDNASEAAMEQQRAQERSASAILDLNRRITQFKNNIIVSFIDSGIFNKLEDTINVFADFISSPETLGRIQTFLDNLIDIFSDPENIMNRMMDTLDNFFDRAMRYLFGETEQQAAARKNERISSAETTVERYTTQRAAMLSPELTAKQEELMAKLPEDIKNSLKSGTLTADAAATASANYGVSAKELTDISNVFKLKDFESKIGGNLSSFYDSIVRDGNINQQALNSQMAQFGENSGAMSEIAMSFIEQQRVLNAQIQQAQTSVEEAKSIIIESTPGIISEALIPSISSLFTNPLVIAGVVTAVGGLFAAPIIATMVAGRLAATIGASLLGGAAVSAGGAGAAAGAASLLGKLGKGLKVASPMGLASIGLGVGADAIGRDTTAGASLGVGSTALGYGSAGALAGSVIPGVGTAIGAGVGAAIGTGVGLYQNWDTLFGEDSYEDVMKQRAEIHDKLSRSIQGENAFWGSEERGRINAQEKLQELDAKLNQLVPSSQSIPDTQVSSYDRSQSVMRDELDGRSQLETVAIDKHTEVLKGIESAILGLRQTIEERLNSNNDTMTSDELIERLDKTMQSVSSILAQMRDIDTKIEKNTRAIDGNYTKNGFGRI